MRGKIKRMNIREFRELGFLQEVNRLFFHPLGLALEVKVNKGKPCKLGGIWDYRNDPEGVVFGDLSEKDARIKAENVKKQKAKLAKTRMKSVGFLVQPIGSKLK